MRSAEEYPRLTALLDSLGGYSPDVGMCLPTHMLQMMGYSQLAITGLSAHRKLLLNDLWICVLI